VAIVGPTAVGKSALALHLAEVFGGEIINADSRQVYQFMDIGTAKPSAEERQHTHHYLFDITTPEQEFGLAIYLALARQSVADIHERARLPILVGGTGQYVWAMLEGWSVPKVAADPSLRARLQAAGRESLYEQLCQIDPEAAANIGPNNTRRLVRALEVYYLSGVPFSQSRLKIVPPFRYLAVGLTTSREELYHRIDSRIDIMIRNGWLNEVKNLLAKGYWSGLPSFSAVGYRELVAHLRGEITLAEAVTRIKYSTHRFARHQYSWFRLKDPRIHWLQSAPGVETDAEELVATFLSHKL
jgi:tRNA dimethylallyltransferase